MPGFDIDSYLRISLSDMLLVAISTLLLTADSLDAQGASLEAARILAINATKGTSVLVNLPVDLALTVDDEPTTLSELYSSGGYASCVVPLGRASGLRFSNGVVVSTEDVLGDAAKLAGSDADELLDSASEFVTGIKTNLDAWRNEWCVGAVTGRTGRCITVLLDGGELQIEYSEADNHVYMTGPACEVFQGAWTERF